MAQTMIPITPFNPELQALVDDLNWEDNMTLSTLQATRDELNSQSDAEQAISGRPVSHTELKVQGPDNNSITLSIFHPNAEPKEGKRKPCFYYTHGGGFCAGTRFIGMKELVGWCLDFDAMAVTVEYRHAPEHPFPAPLNDCYAGLLYVAKNAEELGVDAEKIIVVGGSAGGGLGAALSLMARDKSRKGDPESVKIFAQCLFCPMLDHRLRTTSSRQFVGRGHIFDRGAGEVCWGWYLGGESSTYEESKVSIYASPATAEDLSDLPNTFLDVGSAEIFRDETVDFAMRIWKAGGQAELHVWPGGFHAFFVFKPDAKVSIDCVEVKKRWIGKILGA